MPEKLKNWQTDVNQGLQGVVSFSTHKKRGAATPPF
jgi:hypothetical protein